MDTTTIPQRAAPRRQTILYSVVSVGLLLMGLISGAAMNAKGWLHFGSGGENKVPIYVAADQRNTDQVTLNTGFASIAKAVTPAVVTVQTSSRVRPRQFPFFDSPFDMDPFRDFFFRRGVPGQPDREDQQTPRRQTPRQRQSPEDRGRLLPSGLGSGVIVSPDGYILTNNHVVDGAEKVEVTLNDRRNLTAKIVGTDPPSDIAVLKIEGSNFPTVSLGDSGRVDIGDVVLAVGNPLGVGQTVTMGIISAKGRSTRNAGSGSYEDFLQTDAAINRGNSGGALVNLKGELIGIPTQILSQTGGSIGIGFAIPATMARNVMDQLIRGGKVNRGKLGLVIGDLDSDLAKEFGFQDTRGALVQDIEPGQPAERAGLKPGDIMTEFQGQRIDDSAQLRNLVAQTAPGTTVKLKIWRDGSSRELSATLSTMDTKTASRESSGGGGSPSPNESALAGVLVENLTPEMARRLNLPTTARGVVVSEISVDSIAAEAGLREGDVIEEINRQPVANLSQFNAALQKAGRGSVLLRLRRADGGLYIVIKPR
jgi:serine protease Do